MLMENRTHPRQLERNERSCLQVQRHVPKRTLPKGLPARQRRGGEAEWYPRQRTNQGGSSPWATVAQPTRRLQSSWLIGNNRSGLQRERKSWGWGFRSSTQLSRRYEI
jgi:hypothetical protein